MRVSSGAVLCAFLVVSSAGLAQAPANAAAVRARIDPNRAEQAGRSALYKYLDDIAAKDEAARRAEIARITTRNQALIRQQQVRFKLLGLMGGGFERTPLNAKVLGSTQMDGFRIEKVVFESQPQFFVTALLYLPEGQKTGNREQGTGKVPAIVIAPGHQATGKASDFFFASTFARNGFAVLSYDPIGQGERLQYLSPQRASSPGTPTPDPARPGVTLATGSTGEHAEAGLQPTLIGDAVARYFVWDGMRAVDYLLTRPEIDAERIGAFGCSGGGVMTAMLGAADPRIHAIATACYLTTMDALLPALGPQDAEQSTPGFIAAGFDFADWVELAAPRPYAIVGTVSDMFPWAGLLETAQEARRFYALFDAKAAGVKTNAGAGDSGQRSAIGGQLSKPTGPALNPDTPNAIAADAPLQVIAGIGGHGNLKPLTSQIVGFFLVNLAHSDAVPVVVPAPDVPARALQVTETGQVATSYPGSATVFSLNLKRAAKIVPVPVSPQTLLQVQTDVREVTNAEAAPGALAGSYEYHDPAAGGVDIIYKDTSQRAVLYTVRNLASEAGITLPYSLCVEYTKTYSAKQHPAMLVLREPLASPTLSEPLDLLAGTSIDRLPASGDVILTIAPRPSPPGVEETKSPILGPFYMTELRAELVGKTLLGMRVDDVIRAVDYLASREDVDPNNITAVASGHMGLVLLHAAVLDPRLKHITVDHVLESYRGLLEAPMPLDAPQDILPGVLLKYDIPDLVRVLGTRLTATDWLAGTANLAGTAKP
jgi:cephalosporin-C deacetylase-like acetyl esterase